MAAQRPGNDGEGEAPLPAEPGDPISAEALDEGAAAAIAAAVQPAKDRLVADAGLIEALVRIDEIEVATRAIDEQRADLLEYAIDLTEAVAEAVRSRDGDLLEDPADPDAGELGR